MTWRISAWAASVCWRGGGLDEDDGVGVDVAHQRVLHRRQRGDGDVVLVADALDPFFCVTR